MSGFHFHDVFHLLNRGEGSNSNVFGYCVKNDDVFAVGQKLEQNNLSLGVKTDKESPWHLKMCAAYTTSEHPNGMRVERLYPGLADGSIFTFKLLPNELP